MNMILVIRPHAHLINDARSPPSQEASELVARLVIDGDRLTIKAVHLAVHKWFHQTGSLSDHAPSQQLNATAYAI